MRCRQCSTLCTRSAVCLQATLLQQMNSLACASALPNGWHRKTQVLPAGKCYTMMSPDIDDEGQLIDPVKVPWSEGGVFTTPPGIAPLRSCAACC